MKLNDERRPHDGGSYRADHANDHRTFNENLIICENNLIKKK